MRVCAVNVPTSAGCITHVTPTKVSFSPQEIKMIKNVQVGEKKVVAKNMIFYFDGDGKMRAIKMTLNYKDARLKKY